MKKNIHEYSYRVNLFVKGNINPEIDWIMDFTEIKDIFKPILSKIDHSMLNEIEGLKIRHVKI